MQQLTIAHLKKAIELSKAQQFKDSDALRKAILAKQAVDFANRRTLGQELQSLYSGLNVDKLRKMLAQNQKKFQHALKKEQVARANSQRKAVLSGLDTQRKALQILGSPPNSPYVVLDLPFGILSSPDATKYVLGEQEKPWDSFFKILIELETDQDVGGSPEFDFYYRWSNDSLEDVVVNVSTSPLLQGVCEVTSEPSEVPLPANLGDLALLEVSVQLSLFETWKNPITTQPAFQDSQIATIASLEAMGGNLIDALNGNYSVQYQAITDSFPLSYRSFLIPARSTAVFQVGLTIGFTIIDLSAATGGPGGSTATVTADFASDNFGYRVTSLAVLLEIVNRGWPVRGAEAP